MILTLERLCERAAALGRHVRRYIHVVQKHRERVISHLERAGVQGRISFGDPARDLRAEMDLMASVAPGAQERQDFLAFYYALQYLIMEIHCLDVLKYHLIQEGGQRLEAYRQCYTYAQARFTELVTAYLSLLADTYLEERFAGRYAIFSVGTLGDRDDIDVAVVDDLDEKERGELSRQLARLGQVMLRTSCNLHFHMAEVIGPPGLSAPIERYDKLAERRPYDPVIISQMICASPLAGSAELATRFARRVTGRFYYHPSREQVTHEGFLRAMLGEVQELLQKPVAEDAINPKENGLRAIKGYLALGKAMHHVPQREWSAILEFLRRKNPRSEAGYAVLEENLAFLETTRYLYQLMVVEDEEIGTREESGQQELDEVAELMGFRRRGGLAPHVSFLITYYDGVEALRGALDELLDEDRDHLRRVTSLSFFFHPEELDERREGGNLALTHSIRARRFYGTHYWSDLLDELAREGSPVPGRYVRDLARLSPRRRQVVMRGLVEWGGEDAASFLRFLSLIQPHFVELGEAALFKGILDLAFEHWEERERAADEFAALFGLWPAVLHDFLKLCNEAQLKRFQALAGGRITRAELRAPGKLLRHLVAVLCCSSRAYRRHFEAAIERHPQSLQQIAEPDQLRQLADTLYGQSERFSDLFSRREWLEAYHHLESMRLGLELFQGRPYSKLLQDYRLGMHILLRSLYFLCRRELYDIYRMEWSQRHSIAVFLDAGDSGFQPFHPELRASVFLFQKDEELVHFFREVVSSFHDEVQALGITLGPCTWEGGTLIKPRPLEEHRALLEWRAEAEADPLARLEVLKLNRIIGTRGHMRDFEQVVIEPLLQPIRADLVRLFSARLAARLEASESLSPDAPLAPCAMPGGLRDYEIFQLFLYARGQGELPQGDFSELEENMTRFHVLATARRLLRWESEGEGIEEGFFARHGELLALRPELSAALLEQPLAGFHRLARRSLELMGRIVVGET